MSYRQLTLDERYQVQTLHALGFTQVDIGRTLARHASTISRELRRNARVAARYDATAAQAAARRRRVAKGERCRRIQGWLKDLVEGKLRLAWSPEQISGRLRLEHGIRLSHETIYQHVIRDTRRRGMLRYCLRFGGYKHHRFKTSKMAQRTRLRKGWLRQRSVAANERTELGHWERDCVLGQRGGAALLTIVDRKSRYSRIRRVQKVDVKHVAAATVAALDSNVVDAVKSITNDNGSEFQGDAKLQIRMGVPIFFTEPSSPWQRGSIENLNGLIRQFVPKGADIDRLPAWSTKALEDSLNFRPRKTLGYRSPHEVHFRRRLALISNQRMHFGLEFSLAS
jgi:IS30 family transposase